MEFELKEKVISTEDLECLFNLGLKWCHRCRTVKSIEEFGKDRSNKYGLDSTCKECRNNLAKKRRSDFPDHIRKIRRDSRNKYAEKSRLNKKEWALKNKDHIREYKKDRYNNDPKYKLAAVCRQLVKRMFKSTGIKKCYKTQEILGYTSIELKEHIEKQLKPGMTWDNYGDWHIDHIIPISSASDLDEGIKLSRLNNLQPLWARENILKGDNF
jgi:hypothetical protein